MCGPSAPPSPCPTHVHCSLQMHTPSQVTPDTIQLRLCHVLSWLCPRKPPKPPMRAEQSLLCAQHHRSAAKTPFSPHRTFAGWATDPVCEMRTLRPRGPGLLPPTRTAGSSRTGAEPICFLSKHRCEFLGPLGCVTSGKWLSLSEPHVLHSLDKAQGRAVPELTALIFLQP